MDKRYYTVEKGTQCLLSLLKAHGIHKIVASPGTTNMVFVGSVQNDSWFDVYSSVDERSAAYIACGMAAESNEPVVIVCTGATASRNYLPGLTEAYYRKLPVLAVTYNSGVQNKYHLIPQQIDRSVIPNDVSRMAIDVPVIKDETDAWLANININKALLALKHKGGGPVHINISTTYSRDFSVRDLPAQRVVRRIVQGEDMPPFPAYKRVAIFVGSHRSFDEKTTEAIARFCEVHNGVVFCDHTSGYYGKYRVLSALIGSQKGCRVMQSAELVIHLGEISGDYYAPLCPNEVWRVCIDGEIKDTFHKLSYVFQMTEREFFSHYAEGKSESVDTFWDECMKEYADICSLIPELPFSNIWIAEHTSKLIPSNSIVHLGILNTLRSWNLFEFEVGVQSYSNVGGFGIDGAVSTVIGASLSSPTKICFLIVGDLAFFYDLNSLGNRHIGKNLRVMLINNGKGTEFTNVCHPCSEFGEQAKPYMAAAGHFGNQSQKLVRHIAEDLGFEYISASNKDEFLKNINRFTDKEGLSKSVIFEVFTDSKDESDALETILTLKADASKSSLKSKFRYGVAKLIGEKGRKIIKIIRE